MKGNLAASRCGKLTCAVRRGDCGGTFSESSDAAGLFSGGGRMRRKKETFLKSRKGAALLEFVFCFPILFVLFLFAVQFAYIMITWQVVHYSAYMGARSAMTVNNLQRKNRAETVAKRILAVVSGSVSSTVAEPISATSRTVTSNSVSE